MLSLKITILIDNSDSWIISHGEILRGEFSMLGHEVKMVHKHEQVEKGDILMLLSCNQIFKSLDLNNYNLVVHESDLPKGRGMSPFTWQIMEGKARIPVTLLEAIEILDAGVIYDQLWIDLDGNELVDDWRELQGKATVDLLLNFVKNYPDVEGTVQEGKQTIYANRTLEDSKLDLSKTIEEQFNLLRVVDNERYPAWFERNGVKYKLEIYKLND